MREAEIAVVNHVATAEQRRRVAAMASERTRAGRRRVWMELDARGLRPRPSPTAVPARPGMLRSRPGLSSVVAPRVPRTTAFWSIAVLLLLVLAASGVPSPLYRVYQQEFGFSSGVLTVVFGVYAFALLAALLVVGALSDHIGRRPVLFAALLLQAGGMVIFLVADGVGWLLAARIVQGLSMGALTGSLGAALLDFQRSDRPLGALVNSASPGLGLSLGALGAGLLVEFVPAPTTWVFGVLTVALVLAAGGVLLLPESSPAHPGALASLRPQVHVPAAQRRDFLLVLPCLVATWALGGLYLALGPSLADEVFGMDGRPGRRPADPRHAGDGGDRVGPGPPAGRRARHGRRRPRVRRRRRGHGGLAADRLRGGVLRRRRGLGPRLRRSLPGRHGDGDPRSRPGRAGRPAVQRLRRRLPRLQRPGDRWPASPPRRSGCRPRPSSTAPSSSAWRWSR